MNKSAGIFAILVFAMVFYTKWVYQTAFDGGADTALCVVGSFNSFETKPSVLEKFCKSALKHSKHPLSKFGRN
jgi:hypothetical protein